MFATSIGSLGISGTAILRALARAVTMEAALGKRSSGSLARLRRMIADKAGEICGFIRVGEGGIVLICCLMMASGLSPWKGLAPVQIS